MERLPQTLGKRAEYSVDAPTNVHTLESIMNNIHTINSTSRKNNGREKIITVLLMNCAVSYRDGRCRIWQLGWCFMAWLTAAEWRRFMFSQWPAQERFSAPLTSVTSVSGETPDRVDAVQCSGARVADQCCGCVWCHWCRMVLAWLDHYSNWVNWPLLSAVAEQICAGHLLVILWEWILCCLHWSGDDRCDRVVSISHWTLDYLEWDKCAGWG